MHLQEMVLTTSRDPRVHHTNVGLKSRFFPGRAAWCLQVQVKEEIWNLMNADWLEKQAAKQAGREAGGHCLFQCLDMRI